MPPGARWTAPAGGSAFWVELPTGVDPVALAAAAAERGVAYAPGEAFRLAGEAPPAVYLSFAAAGPDAIREGVEQLAALVAGQLATRPSARRSP
jgi:2-aminoadipate transaminase